MSMNAIHLMNACSRIYQSTNANSNEIGNCDVSGVEMNRINDTSLNSTTEFNGLIDIIILIIL